MLRSLALVACCAVVATPFALADEGNSSDAPTPTTERCTPAKQLLARHRWRERHPLAGHEICRGAPITKLKREFFTYRAYRQIAHVRGFHEGDPYLEWLPRIPRYVVACETRGSYGEGRWHARNASGASGPAQLMPEWHPPAIHDNQDKLRYWRIVHGLWGHTSWSCA